MNLVKHQDKVLEKQELLLWGGDIPKDIPPATERPEIAWKGAPVPKRVWMELVSFFRHANRAWKSEAQARLAYNATTCEWKAIVLPQRVATGMVSNEIKQPDAAQQLLREKAMAELGGGFAFNGTVHSHCDCSAFASSVDAHDEKTQPGLHMTFGRISSDRVHVHGRVSFRGVVYPVDWKNWLPPDLEVETEPNPEELSLPIPDGFEETFPPHWLECCFDSPPPAAKPKASAWGEFERPASKESWSAYLRNEQFPWNEGSAPARAADPLDEESEAELVARCSEWADIVGPAFARLAEEYARTNAEGWAGYALDDVEVALRNLDADMEALIGILGDSPTALRQAIRFALPPTLGDAVFGQEDNGFCPDLDDKAIDSYLEDEMFV